MSSSYFDVLKGQVPTLRAAMGLNKPAGDHVNAQHQIVMRGESDVPVPLREALAAFVSRLNMCPLCHNAHRQVAELLGYDGDAIVSACLDIDSAPLPEAHKPLFRYAKKLTLAPSTLCAHDKALVIQAGWTENDLNQVIYIVSLFNFINRFVLGHGIRVPPRGVELSARQLASEGYWNLEQGCYPDQASPAD